MSQTRPLFHLLSVFSIKYHNSKKIEKCPYSIRCQDSNSQPSDYKSPPPTTRPGVLYCILDMLNSELFKNAFSSLEPKLNRLLTCYWRSPTALFTALVVLLPATTKKPTPIGGKNQTKCLTQALIKTIKKLIFRNIVSFVRDQASF